MTERLVEDYLAAVARACAGLSPAIRMELLADLREHIAVARAELPEQTEAAIHGILDRLGEPAVIAAEARASAPERIVSAPVRPVVAGPAMLPLRRSSDTSSVVLAIAILVPIGILLAVLGLGAFLFYTRS